MRRAGTCAAVGLMAGCDMQFGDAGALFWLWLAPALAAALIYWARRARRALANFAAHPQRLGAAQHRIDDALGNALVVIAVLMLVVAAAQPRWGMVWQDVKREGVDVIIALDVSDSMLVQDVQSKGHLSRLQQAKREIVDLLRVLHDDRVGLVAFAGKAFIQCPLTLDYNAAAVFLDDLSTDLIAVKGTAIGEGIRTSVAAMAGAEHSAQAIILITDGEDHGGEALSAAREAGNQRVRVFPIGIGRSEGAPIPMPEGGFHRDADGNLVLSKLDEKTLEQIASLTGGLYTHSMAGEMDLGALYKRGIRSMLRPQQSKGKRRQGLEERYVYFVALAALALMGEALLAAQPNKRRQRP